MKNFDINNKEHILEANRLIDEEEAKLNFLGDNKEKLDNSFNEPLDEDQERKKEKFKSYLFSEAKNITTPELLAQIVNIIQGTYVDEIRIRNEAVNLDPVGESMIEDGDNTENKTQAGYQHGADGSNKALKEPEFIIDSNGVKKYK